MILLIQDEQLDSAAPTPAAKLAYTQAVRDACVDWGIQFRPAVDGDVIEQRVGAIGTPAHVPAVYLGSFLRWLHERGAEAASDAAAVPMWNEGEPMKVSAWEGNP